MREKILYTVLSAEIANPEAIKGWPEWDEMKQ